MSQEPIAIVGMACRLPGGVVDPSSFWRFLKSGEDGISEVPPDRFSLPKFFDPDPLAKSRTHVCRAGFLDQSIERFDWEFFGISPREAAQMDPQQRFLLEVVWESLEDAGIPPHSLRGTETGVYIGAFLLDNLVTMLSPLNRPAITTHTATSATMVMLSNRISHAYDLRGPSLSIDTACSSSLMSLHVACQGLRSGDCDLALAGGVNLLLRPEPFMAMSKGGFLAADGRCKTFDASADGYARGEGVGVLVLKNLQQAIEDGDRIHSLILATGVNQDGRTPGITLPNSDAQALLLKKVLKRAGVEAHQVQYVEAHGTGTQAGDLAEVRSLDSVLSENADGDQRVWVGAVKTQIGHLEAAAGVASVIKTSLVTQNREVPPNLNLEDPNPALNIEETSLQLPLTTEALPSQGAILACVNSFGYGGSNVCAVMKSPPRLEIQASPSQVSCLFPISAASQEALQRRALSLSRFLEQNPDTDLQNLAFTLTRRRSHLAHRRMVKADSCAELAQSLKQTRESFAAPESGKGLVCLYSGMGAQSYGMGEELAKTEPVYAQALEQCEDIWQRLSGKSLKLSGSGPMEDPIEAQPANLALQIALTMLLRSKGVKADAVVGHSVGELAAAWAVGVLSLESAFKLCYHRCRLQQSLRGQGTMLVVMLSPEELSEWTAEHDELEVAAYNGPRITVLAGPEPGLRALVDKLEQAAISATFVKVSVPYHSSAMDSLEAEFKDSLAELTFSHPTRPFFSTVTGEQESTRLLNVDYWWDNARQPVRLVSALQSLGEAGFHQFIELGPHPVLGAAVRSTLGESSPSLSLHSFMRRGEKAGSDFYSGLRELFCWGYEFDWTSLYPSGLVLSLPTYPWQEEYLWSETSVALDDRRGESQHPFLHGPSGSNRWTGELNSHWHEFLQDHKVAGEVIFPASAYIELALEVAQSLLKEESKTLENLSFDRALNPSSTPRLELSFEPDSQRLFIRSGSLDQERFHLNCQARLPKEVFPSPNKIDAESIKERLDQNISIPEFYQALEEKGLSYGPAFRTVSELWPGDRELFAKLKLNIEDQPFHLHPCLLDGAFHALFCLFLDDEEPLRVPVGLKRLKFHRKCPPECYAHLRVTSSSDSALEADLELFDEKGEVIAEGQGLRLQNATRSRAKESEFSLAYSPAWLKSELETSDLVQGPCKVIGRSDLRDALVELGAELTDDTGLAKTLVYSITSTDFGLKACRELLQVLKTPETLENFVLVTERAHQVAGLTKELQPSGAGTWGLVRVFAQENPSLRVQLIDGEDLEQDSGLVAQEVLARCDESEVAFRRGQRWVHRMQYQGEAGLRPSQREQNLSLQKPSSGRIEDLEYMEAARRKPISDEVEIEIDLSALNFKDLMKVLGLLPREYLSETYFQESIGMECSGTVIRVGSKVSRWKPGDKVAAVASSGMARFVTVRQDFAVPMPASRELGIQHMNFIAAYQGLFELGQLAEGQTVLVHSGAGGVGQAALQLCRLKGAKVFATAGSEEKREYLRQQGVDLVSDSRSLVFYDEVLKATEGQGVDLVLNSLSGEFLRKSLELLKRNGRFVEIGKRDITESGLLELRHFKKNQSFSAVDIDTMIQDDPDHFVFLLNQVNELFCSGKLEAMLCQVFPAQETAEAFRCLSKSAHIGKLAIEMSQSGVPHRPSPRAFKLDPEATYLVTGGFGGFGLESSIWLSEQGAKNLVILSRSGAKSDDARRFVERFEKSGGKLYSPKVDVSDSQALKRIFQEGEKEWPPLRGIIHAAAVLQDAPLSSMTTSSLDEVMSVKAGGAWSLHQLSRTCELDFFVLYSSVSALVGNPGQANYAAANAYLDALAHYRQAQGLPALSVNWGAIGEVGMLARDAQVQERLQESGLSPMPVALALQGLNWALEQGYSQVGLLDMDWSQWSKKSLNQSSLLSELEQGVLVKEQGAQRDRLLSLEGNERFEASLLALRETVSSIIRISPERLAGEVALEQIGFDSLMSTELRNALQWEFGLDLPGLTLQNSSLRELALWLSQALEQEESTQEFDVDEMSEEELDQLLVELQS